MVHAMRMQGASRQTSTGVCARIQGSWMVVSLNSRLESKEEEEEEEESMVHDAGVGLSGLRGWGAGFRVRQCSGLATTGIIYPPREVGGGGSALPVMGERRGLRFTSPKPRGWEPQRNPLLTWLGGPLQTCSLRSAGSTRPHSLKSAP